MYRELGSFERLLIATSVIFVSSVLFASSATAQGGAVAAKIKFANDYNAAHFKDVIADGEMLRKFNELDPQSRLIIGQAYYKLADYPGCMKYIREAFGASPSGTALLLLKRCKELASN